MTINDWTDDRLTRAAIASLLGYGANEVLGLAARLGPASAWQLLRSSEEAIEGQLKLPGLGRPPGTSGQAFKAWAASINPDQVASRTEAEGFRFIIPGDDEWPSAIDDLAGCEMGRLGGLPVGLWVAGPGHLVHWCQDAVAMVGSRSATRYGEAVAMNMASALAGEPDVVPWTVVSGGAFGIDAASHRGALLTGGRTIAVFANGLDLYYPPGNTALIKMIKEQGLAVSELPPGAHPTKHGFLARNRIIAALASGVVVVEAGLRSGARNTVSWAAAMGRVVMAVPGPVTSAMSETPHRLIRDGEATLIACADDVRALLQPIGQSPELPFTGAPRPGDELSGDESVVREALPARRGITLNEVALASGVPIQRCIESLRRLAGRGYAVVDEAGRWCAYRQFMEKS